MSEKTAYPNNGSSQFSEFIRNATVAEQEKVYGEVLKRATARQNRLLEEARLKQAAAVS